MKNSFNDAQFANRFSRVYIATNPGMKLSQWEVNGVSWHRDRHSYYGQAYAFRCDAHTLVYKGRKPWAILYVDETWWDEAAKNVVRSNHWGRQLNGSKIDAHSWFKMQEDALPK